MGLLDRLRPPKPYRQLTPHEAQAALDDGTALLLDMRAQDEWDRGHAPLALHVPRPKLPERAGRLPKGKDLILVCRTGSSSKTTAEVLAEKGYPVAQVSGGMRAWAKAGLPVVIQGGRPGSVR